MADIEIQATQEHKPAVVCNNCGWIHFQVSKAFCEKWEVEWNAYLKTLTPEEVLNFYGRDSLTSAKWQNEYCKCSRCGGSFKDFSDATQENCDEIYGSTIGPILDRTVDLP